MGILISSLLVFLQILPAIGRAHPPISHIRSRDTNGTDAAWTTALQRAADFVSQMTLEEMNNITYGRSRTNGCSGIARGAPRVGFPELCLADAGNGLRAADGVNAYASGIHIGATWNEDLAYDRALDMGREFRGKGVNVILGPVVGPLGRTAEGGRNWEGFTNDPYLAGILVGQTITGLQKSVIASVKHFILNEQETNRGGNADILASSSNLDDKTIHEIYLWPFQDAVYAGVACVMCSYNRINQTYACENDKTQNGLLKGELDFKGFVVSDWGGQHSGLASAKGGLDMAMPNSNYWNGTGLADAVNNGTLDRTRLEDMATRIVAAWYYIGQDTGDFPDPNVNFPIDRTDPHELVDVRDPAAAPRILQQAVEGHVLLKNTNNALPLGKPKVLSIFGYDAYKQLDYDPSPASEDALIVPWSANSQDTAVIEADSDEPGTYQGTLIVGGGSGGNSPPYISDPLSALTDRGIDDGTEIFHSNSTDPGVDAATDACLVFINEWASEGYDRPGLANAPSDDLVNNVAGKCNNTIVVVHNAGLRIVDAWIENENVTAVIFGHLPGQDSGRALVQVLYGEQSPSGRLPYTVAKKAGDYGVLNGPCLQGVEDLDPQCDYVEGTAIDYRHFLKEGIEPRFAFGYGLTYSTFEYSELSVAVAGNLKKRAARIASAPQEGLWDTYATVTATLKNTGEVEAAEVAQLYLSIPGADTKQLRGFKKVLLESGASSQVEFSLRRKDVSSWDVVKQEWVVPTGEFGVEVGKSVADTQLNGTFTS